MRAVMTASAMLIAIGAGACSSPVSEAELTEQARVATAEALGVDPAVAPIEVTSIDRGPTSASWSARYEGQHVSCSGNEKFQLPDCRVDQETASN